MRCKVRAHIWDDSRNLLVVKIRDHIGPSWEVPGGGIEEHETVKQALARELFEEIGIKRFMLKTHLSLKYQEIFEPEVIAKLSLNYVGQVVEDFGLMIEGTKPKIAPQTDEVMSWKWIADSEVSQYLNYMNQFEVYNDLKGRMGFKEK